MAMPFRRISQITTRKRFVHSTNRRNFAEKDSLGQRSVGFNLPFRLRRRRSLLQWILIVVCLSLSIYLIHSTTPSSFAISNQRHHSTRPKSRVLQPTSNTLGEKKKDPEKWLLENSNMNHFETGREMFNDRPKAAIISLVRNEELEGILQSMRQLEWHWNRRYNYPWMFFSEKEFSEEFKVNLSTFSIYLLSHPYGSHALLHPQVKSKLNPADHRFETVCNL